MYIQGSLTAPILFLTASWGVHCKAEQRVFSDYLGAPLYNALKTAGIKEAQYCMAYFANHQELKQLLVDSKANVVVPLGEQALHELTGLNGIQKWQCSVVVATAEHSGRKCLPMYHPDYVMKYWSEHVFLLVGCQKLRWEMHSARLNIPERTVHLSPPFEETMRYLKECVLTAPRLAVDFEFGAGQINTVGFAISRTEAIAIKTLPDGYTPEEYHALWVAIAEALESDIPKVIQHAATEVTWAARYGISINNVEHDTMWAQKFLHPELNKGLDNVGRMYTPFTYWKDDVDSWTNIKDWQRHLRYNCYDTIATFWAYFEQRQDLRERKLFGLFYGTIMKYQPVIQEMCNTGLLLNEQTILKMKEDVVREAENYTKIINQQSMSLLNKTINPRSPKQLKEALTEMGMKLPTKRNKGSNESTTSTDKKALIKLRRQHPNSEILPALIGLSAANKKLSSYVDFNYDRRTNRVHYTLDGCGTETGRWSGYGSAWGDGFNPQTVPKGVRRCFIAEAGTVLVQIDLQQAESRYVAWDGPDAKFMDLLSAGKDIHRYVAGQIFKKDETMVSTLQRQLGKKAGHASNYGTGPRTFAEMALVEMNYYLEEREAKEILEGYLNTFPGVRRRQQNIKNQVYQQRKLTTPLGRERHFYGRMDDGTFREAFAYCPQSTIPDITNQLMLKLWQERDYLGLSYEEEGRFLLQVHDSLLLQAKPERIHEIAEFARDYKSWHPKIILAGGDLVIPVDVEFGTNWKEMEKL